ncbi:unnamed protein product [Lactuca saligna]|uniref:Uncharacterized protein n=1 Tax=Lactuca saligna TaxID=75948 RepID=A0AA35Z097_LACSI|nr:unnamed protein product [Lactuca saligna]CAI9283565.1 unnamed protein product [Lactuca saligna]
MSISWPVTPINLSKPITLLSAKHHLQATTMAPMANLNQIFITFPAIPKLSGDGKSRPDAGTARLTGINAEETQNHPLKPTRRLALGLGSLGLFANSNISVVLAEDNGFWLTGPIPIPRALNMIDNLETGTRSFLKTGVYIADIGTKGRQFRLKKYAFDLLALGDLIVITAATSDEKPPLLDLANRLFDTVEKLEDAVKKQDLPQTELLYKDTTVILQEVMTKMA